MYKQFHAENLQDSCVYAVEPAVKLMFRVCFHPSNSTTQCLHLNPYRPGDRRKTAAVLLAGLLEPAVNSLGSFLP
jgi:hypothetical protein